MASGSMLNPSSAERPQDRSSLDSISAAIMDRPPSPRPQNRTPKKLILCFDGTGNKFHGDESDSNILKIFRMLDRTADDQYHYYQPGIGTYIVSNSLSHTGMKARFRSWYQKAKDSAVGSSFDQHVVGGYRFLMRFYNPGDEIYMFGFSRGSYIARFLAEMLDYIGLLSHGNEEMVSFAWKAFANWQSRRGSDKDEKLAEEEEGKKHEMYHFMKGFRETFSRPVGRIRFLGLFDTVNSVPRFETAWMQRSKFPYTARSSARVIRHAVSIDERRAKFRQDLMYQQGNKRHRGQHGHWKKEWEHMMGRGRDGDPGGDTESTERVYHDDRARRPSQQTTAADRPMSGNPQNSKYMPYRARSKSAARGDRRLSVGCDASEQLSVAEYEDNGDDQDIDEVWFAGGHGDVGGGWQTESSDKNASHVPLIWMVREAIRAGLRFDLDKVRELDCYDVYTDFDSAGFKDQRGRERGPDIRVNQEDEEGHEPVMPPSPDTIADDEGEDHKNGFLDMMHKAHLARIHDSLEYGGGLSRMAVTAWNMMEWMPFRRMDLQSDGTWKPINWPLPRGEVRDIPDNVRVHGSVIRRMKMDPTYRPGNLIVGGGGRGIRVAPEEYGIGEWVCVQEEGDPIGEIWVRKGPLVKLDIDKKKMQKARKKAKKEKKREKEENNEKKKEKKEKKKEKHSWVTAGDG